MALTTRAHDLLQSYRFRDNPSKLWLLFSVFSTVPPRSLLCPPCPSSHHIQWPFVPLARSHSRWFPASRRHVPGLPGIGPGVPQPPKLAASSRLSPASDVHRAGGAGLRSGAPLAPAVHARLAHVIPGTHSPHCETGPVTLSPAGRSEFSTRDTAVSAGLTRGHCCLGTLQGPWGPSYFCSAPKRPVTLDTQLSLTVIGVQ